MDEFVGMLEEDAQAADSLDNALRCLLEKYRDPAALKETFHSVEAFWDRYPAYLHPETGDSRFDAYVGHNLPFQVLYQTYVSRAFAWTQKSYRETGFQEIQDIYASMYYLSAMGENHLIKELLSNWIRSVFRMGYAYHDFTFRGKEPGDSDFVWEHFSETSTETMEDKIKRILNLFWAIGCIPIVTIGASTIAVFTVTLKMTEGREGLSMTTQFWSAFVKNLKHGVPLTLILLTGIWSVWVDWQIFDKIEGNPIGFLILALAVIFLLLAHFLFVFPLEARYANRLLMNLSNARKLFIRYAGRSLGLVGILFLQFLLFTQVNTVLIFAGFFCLPILMIYTTSQIAMPIFRQVEKTGGAPEEFKITSDLY